MDANKYLPEAVSTLIEELNKLPTIGRKSAQRLAFHLLRLNTPEIDDFAGSILAIKDNVKFCSKCFNLTDNKSESPLCKICASHSRNQKVICVVEEVLDLIAIENTLEFNGTYHVLHGALSPLDGVGPDNLKLRELFERIRLNKGKMIEGSSLVEETVEYKELEDLVADEEIEEIILATSTNSEGEATALYIYENLKREGVKISRIASGLPVGGDLDYADEGTLRRALRGRSGF
jgi:recombination protein RecR